MEPISNYCTAINEMMLQSNEDKIRVFPAIPSVWDTTKLAFTLLARGAFIVSAERNEQAQVTMVGIKSLKGNLCRLQNPWPGKKNIVIHEKNGNNKVVKFRMKENDVIVFPTKNDTEYTVMIDGERMNERTVYAGTPNMKVKFLENRVRGKISGWNDFKPNNTKK